MTTGARASLKRTHTDSDSTDALGLFAERRFAGALMAIAGLAVIVRLGIRAAIGTTGYWEDGYVVYQYLARTLADGYGYAIMGRPTSYRVPLYALFVAATSAGRNVWALLFAQALVSAGTVICAGLLARRLFGSLAGLLAALLCAAYPYYAWHHLALVETGLYTFLALAGTLLLYAWRDQPGLGWAIAAGAVLGLAVLTRATLLPVALFGAAWMVLAGPGERSLRLRHAGAMLAAVALVLSPWLIRSYTLTGRPNLGTELGASLYAANHPLTFSAYPDQSIDISRGRIFGALAPEQRRALDDMTETAASDWYMARGLAAIAEHPAQFVRGFGRKIAAAFGQLPSPRKGPVGNLGYALAWVPVLILGVAGLCTQRRAWRRDSLIYAHFAVFILISGVLWAHTSHRSYLDVYLMIYAAPLLAAAATKFMRRR